MLYELLEPVAEGGFCTVYRARAYGESGFERFVAVKMLKAEFVGIAEYEAKLEREAQNLARIYHPGVAQVVDFLRINNRAACVLEWIDGLTVEELAKNTPLEERCTIAYSIVVGVAQTLLDLSVRLGKPFVHGDISPRNIVIATGSGMPRLIDFGEAFFVGENKTQALFGTPNFVAPEVEKIGFSVVSDIYSLGKTALFLCPNPPQQIKSVLELMTKEDPKKRFQNWQQVLDALGVKQPAYAAVDKGRTNIKTERLVPETSPVNPANRRWRTVALLFIVAVLVLVVSVLSNKELFYKDPLVAAETVVPHIKVKSIPTATLYLWGLPKNDFTIRIDGKKQKMPRSGVFTLNAGCHKVEVLSANGEFARTLCMPPGAVKSVKVRLSH